MLIPLGLAYFWSWKASRNETWSVVAEGALKRVEYRERTYSRRTGAMVHRTEYYTVRYNTLYFEGGTVLYGIRGKLKEPGTALVRLMQSSHGQYRLEPYGKE